MIERFDHAVIGVPDLESAMGAFRRLGFEVAVGGRHPSLGTRNAIVRFGLDYLELLAVEDPAVARARGPFGRELLSFLDGASGLVGFVLAGTGLQDEVEGLRGLGIGVEGPFEMDRIHPKGGRLEWKLVLPGGSPWRKPWPYLIDWITGEDELLAWDPPGYHANRVGGVAGMDLVVGDLEEAARLYEQALDSGPATTGIGGRERPAATTGSVPSGWRSTSPMGPAPVPQNSNSEDRALTACCWSRVTWNPPPGCWPAPGSRSAGLPPVSTSTPPRRWGRESGSFPRRSVGQRWPFNESGYLAAQFCLQAFDCIKATRECARHPPSLPTSVRHRIRDPSDGRRLPWISTGRESRGTRPPHHSYPVSHI